MRCLVRLWERHFLQDTPGRNETLRWRRAEALLPPPISRGGGPAGKPGELPSDVWRMHAGDMAHGEDPDLDVRGWQPIAVGEKAPNDAVWFRQTIHVPETLNGYDLSGARIWFQIHVDGNGPMPEILYFNGRRVALGEDLEPVVLFDKAQPGETAPCGEGAAYRGREDVSRCDDAHRLP